MNTQEKQKINTKIEELKKTIAELEAKVNEPVQQPWIPHGGYSVMDLHLVDYSVGTSCNRFISKENACYAAEKLKPIFALLSYITEFDKPLSDTDIKYYICKSKNTGDWVYYDLESGDYCPDSVFMSLRCAEELVDKLNKGLVKLD